MWFVCGCASQAIADEAMTPAAFVRQYCLDCHSGPDAENGFDMERLSPLPRQPARGSSRSLLSWYATVSCDHAVMLGS